MTWICGDDGPRKLLGLLYVSGTEPSNCSISRNVGIIRRNFERLVEFADAFFIATLGNGESAELPKAESDGLLEGAFGLRKISGSESRFGGFVIMLEERSGVVGGTDCRPEKRAKSKEQGSFRTAIQASRATPE